MYIEYDRSPTEATLHTGIYCMIATFKETETYFNMNFLHMYTLAFRRINHACTCM